MNTYPITSLSPIRTLGRTTQSRDGALTLFWTASGIELAIRSPFLKLRYRAGFTLFEPWLDILIDEAPTQRLLLSPGEGEIFVYRSMQKAEGEDWPLRRVKILRDTPAMPGDPENLLQLLSLSFEGELLPLPEPSLRLEFIGDSITSGEGCCGARERMEWDSGCFDALKSYPFLTSQMLGASYQVISQSGWGAYCSFLGDTNCAIPPYYEMVCGLLSGEKAGELGARDPWDFSRYQPDAVIVNLGTNDVGSFSESTRQSLLANGKTPAMTLTQEGALPALFEEKLTSTIVSFLKTLRRCNPGAYLIWAYGMLLQGDPVLDSQMKKILREGVEAYQRESGDERASFLLLPPTLPEEFGARQHPGFASHQKTARALSAYLKNLLW